MGIKESIERFLVLRGSKDSLRRAIYIYGQENRQELPGKSFQELLKDVREEAREQEFYERAKITVFAISQDGKTLLIRRDERGGPDPLSVIDIFYERCHRQYGKRDFFPLVSGIYQKPSSNISPYLSEDGNFILVTAILFDLMSPYAPPEYGDHILPLGKTERRFSFLGRGKSLSLSGTVVSSETGLNLKDYTRFFHKNINGEEDSLFIKTEELRKFQGK
ncbi:MAG: hypothetical protein M1575_03360 [Patescibacteria group bacterium]|nr:hypothetical protein [Patescibacteria group bacterium]MCL5095738.1 hypothetical protein [Patescibacteria group bacterium]